MVKHFDRSLYLIMKDKDVTILTLAQDLYSPTRLREAGTIKCVQICTLNETGGQKRREIGLWPASLHNQDGERQHSFL